MSNSNSKNNKQKRPEISGDIRIAIFSSILLLIGALACVWPNVTMVELAYKHQSLDKENKKLMKERRLLRVEKESLQSLFRVNAIAKESLNLKPPREGQVVTVFLKH